jgi:hypothetical protein
MTNEHFNGKIRVSRNTCLDCEHEREREREREREKEGERVSGSILLYFLLNLAVMLGIKYMLKFF